MGCAGHPFVQTPHLDARAARGTRFTNAYTPSPICVPARAAFATGKYAHQTRNWDNVTLDLDTLSQGADFLLHWCYRLDGQAANAQMAAVTPTPSEIATMAKRCGVRQLLLTHFRINMDRDDQHDAAKAMLSKNFSGPSGIAEDLKQFTI